MGAGVDTEQKGARVNRTRFAGRWYPADPGEVEDLFIAARERQISRERQMPRERRTTRGRQTARSAEEPNDESRRSRPVIAILPHAGLEFSAAGQEAFWSRRREITDVSGGGPEAIVILAPSHYRALPRDTTVGAAFTAHETAGPHVPGLPICLGDQEMPSLVEAEHAVELLLPGIGRRWTSGVRDSAVHIPPVGAVLVPLFSSTIELRRAAQRILARLTPRANPARVLWLVSSDFTHYGPRFGYQPFGNKSYGEIRDVVAEHDLRIARAAAAGSLNVYEESLEYADTVCGRHAIALALALLEEVGTAPVEGTVLSYYTSADLARTPARERDFVCYATVEVSSG